MNRSDRRTKATKGQVMQTAKDTEQLIGVVKILVEKMDQLEQRVKALEPLKKGEKR